VVGKGNNRGVFEELVPKKELKAFIVLPFVVGNLIS
jgi:hypothetical protein